MKKIGSLKSVVFDALLVGILRGDFKPGDILNEGTLVEKFGCSRAPVREALAGLCSVGLLQNLPRCGYELVRITMDDIRNMQQFRQILEGGLLETVCQNLTPQRLVQLRELAAKCDRAGESMWNHWEYNAQFHLGLLNCSQNEYACRVLRETLERLKCAYGQHYWDKWDQICPVDTRNHAAILDALEQADCVSASAALRRDLEDFAAFN